MRATWPSARPPPPRARRSPAAMDRCRRAANLSTGTRSSATACADAEDEHREGLPFPATSRTQVRLVAVRLGAVLELFPDTAEIVDGVLHVGGCSAIQLAAEYGTPLVVY